MPLPEPTLDNRRFDQLVSEGRALIPRLAPQWTDHNASDPGITLLELGAWLAEQNIYRFDRLSEEAMRAFVRLVGIEPRMPAVAATVVSIENQNAAAIALPARLQLGMTSAPLFETIGPLFASSARLSNLSTGKSTLLDITAGNGSSDGLAPFGSHARAGHALCLGFDRALDAPAQTLSLHVWTTHWQADAATRAALIAEYEAATVKAAVHCPPPVDWRQHYRVKTIWEFYAGGNSWLPLQDVVDETRALTLTGFVRFTAPVNHQADSSGAVFFIRCRIVSGRFECPPQLARIAFNAVTSEHALSIGEHSLGVARGHALAKYSLGSTSAVAGSVKLRLDNGAGDVQTDWIEVPDFERAGAHEKKYLLDPERAVLQSGDGLRGQALPAGYELFASFRAGGGSDGNIAAGKLTQIPATAENVALVPLLPTLAIPLQPMQWFDATGGAPREMLSQTQARAYDLVSAIDKAVTLDDIERLALATPGVPVARVRAVPNMDAHLPCYPAPGAIVLIVIPPCPKPAPLPSRALLDAVERYLAPRRLVTSEIHAIAPHYRRIGVNATLHLSCDATADAVLGAAIARLNRFLDPLDGGPDGRGWRFGRSVYRSEVMALLADTDGVVRVTQLTLQDGYGNGASATGCCDAGSGGSAHCDNIDLCAHELVMPGRHQLLVESDIPRNLRRSDAHECETA